MNRRWLLLLSVVLYGIACALPALISVRPQSGEAPMYGWHCLVFGILYGFMGFPLIAWIPNPWLWTLWYRAHRGYRTGLMAWLCAVWAVGSLAFLYQFIQVVPVWGTAAWIGSIVAGVTAARIESDGPRQRANSIQG